MATTRAAAPPPPPARDDGSDTDASMAKAIEKLAALVSQDASNPATQEAIRGVAKKLNGSGEGTPASRGRGGRGGEEDDYSDDDDASSVGSRGSSYSGSSRGSSRSGSSYSSRGSRGSRSSAGSSYSGSSRGSRSGSSYTGSDSGSRTPPPRERGGPRSVASSYTAASSRPTPFQLWQAAHVAAAPPKPTVKLSKEEEKQVVNRLTDTTRQRHARMMREQSRRLGQLMGGLSFSPSICAKSREYSQSVQSLEKRLPELEKKKKNKLEKLRHASSERVMHSATFHPDMKTPCVCGVGVGLASSEENGMVEEHTAYCLKFMKACSTINSRNEHQLMGARMRRKVAHLSQYDEYKRIRAQQRRQIMEEVESRELTFVPQINSNSDALAARFKVKQAAKLAARQREAEERQRAIDKASEAGSPLRVLPSNRDVGHEEETFTPKINARSRTIRSRYGGSARTGVFDRLYNSGRHKVRSRNLESRAANEAARGNMEVSEAMLDAADASARYVGRGGSVATDDDAASTASSNFTRASRTFRVGSGRKTSAMADRKDAFNQVVFNSAKHGFLVSRLHRQAHQVAQSLRM